MLKNDKSYRKENLEFLAILRNGQPLGELGLVEFFLITVIFNESNYMPSKHELFCNFRPPRETEVRVVRTYEVCAW